MSTAIFYSGQARTFASCFPNQYWYVLRHFKDPTFFVSVADDAQASSMNQLQERFDGKRVHIEIVKQPEFPEAQALAAKHAHGGYGISAQPQNIMRAFWHYKKAWEMCPNPTCFDQFVRIRPDLWFQEFEPNDAKAGHTHPDFCVTPPWGSYGGINDRFAIMGRRAALAYMNALEIIPKLLAAGCPFHPETLTRAALEDKGCEIVQRMITEFKIRRMPDAAHGNKEWLVPEPILGIELLRASLR